VDKQILVTVGSLQHPTFVFFDGFVTVSFATMRSVADYSSPYMIQTPPITPTSTRIRIVPASELDSVLPDLVQIFRDVVNGGVPLGFFSPMTLQTAHDYWLSIIPELNAGTRLLLVASNDGGVLGSGQLALAQRQNSRHRAEVQKLFVARAARGQGIGKLLMQALHDAALENGRTLIQLNTRVGFEAVGFYKALGYREVGVIPGWTMDAEGRRFDHVEMYRELATALPPA
jgi:GNAT superfamily N-acetyltransferase